MSGGSSNQKRSYKIEKRAEKRYLLRIWLSEFMRTQNVPPSLYKTLMYVKDGIGGGLSKRNVRMILEDEIYLFRINEKNKKM